MTIEERLREAFITASYQFTYGNVPDEVALLKEELSARGLAVCEISKVSEVSAVYGEMTNGEPSVLVTSPGNETSGDVPTGNEGMQTAHLCLSHSKTDYGAEMAETLARAITSENGQHKENPVPLSCDKAKERMESDIGIPASDREQADHLTSSGSAPNITLSTTAKN